MFICILYLSAKNNTIRASLTQAAALHITLHWPIEERRNAGCDQDEGGHSCKPSQALGAFNCRVQVFSQPLVVLLSFA
jgi:hypothetical protein